MCVHLREAKASRERDGDLGDGRQQGGKGLWRAQVCDCFLETGFCFDLIYKNVKANKQSTLKTNGVFPNMY